MSYENDTWTSTSTWAIDDYHEPEKGKGIWKWKAMRALTHIGKLKLTCLLLIEVVGVEGLPASMEGLRLSVCIRKKDSTDSLARTMPSRVSEGAADFEETLFMRCHVYFTPGNGNGTQMKFEPRPFLIYPIAIDADDLDFGKSSVDLSGMIQESISRSFQGTPISQWDMNFNLSGKAAGAQLFLKLGFRIMDKEGGNIYSASADSNLGKSSRHNARKLSKSSFSIPSQRISSRSEAWTPSQRALASDLQGVIDRLDIDEHVDMEDPPEFDIVEKGIEINTNRDDKRFISSEVVKEVVQDHSTKARLMELESIAQQIKELESLIVNEKKGDEKGSPKLDEEEDRVTRQFLQMLDKNMKSSKFHKQENSEELVYVPDLGKSLGCVIQTRNGGCLVASNPLGTAMSRKEVPKLAMQVSKPLVIRSREQGFDLLRNMASMGFELLTSEISKLMPMDDLMGKTAEQIAFEGIAWAIIQGRSSKEGASSSAARTISSVKLMVNAINDSTGVWSLSNELLTIEEVLAMSMHKMEAMAIDALKIQAAEEDTAPLEVLSTKGPHPLASAIPIEDFITSKCSEDVTICALIQMRDPIREYEAVGGPIIAMIQVRENEKRYKVESMQVGSVKVRSLRTNNGWGNEKQKLTALQWLVSHGMEKGRRDRKILIPTGSDLLWSISSRVVGDMWLQPIRNPDIKLAKQVIQCEI